jgi:ElaB/YqjD/DUF883 family membrane-anchored ribosome-binding protein
MVNLRREEIRGDAMEIYFNELSSARTPVDQIVDDLALLVYGLDKLAQGQETDEKSQEELLGKLRQLKNGIQSLKNQAVMSARAADKAIHSQPYVFLGVAFTIGLIAMAGFCVRRK